MTAAPASAAPFAVAPGPLLRLAARLAGADDAEDAVQDAYLRALDGLRHDGNPGSYLRTGVAWAARDRVRQARRRREATLADVHARADPGVSAHLTAVRALLATVLAEAAADPGVALAVAYALGYDYAELAMLTGTTVAAVRARLARARAGLRARHGALLAAALDGDDG